MQTLVNITNFLDETLNTAAIEDFPGAHNGLQISNRKPISSVATAVDASLPVIRQAVEQNHDLLIVHHGLFWQGAQAITGHVYEKFALAIENNLAIYSSHLPLDAHPELGNNILLARKIGLIDPLPFNEWKGTPCGVRGLLKMPLAQLLEQLKTITQAPTHVCPAGPAITKNVGIVTGSAGSDVAKMAAQGIDTFITGEGPHWSYPLAEELEINLIYAGHYATETFGVNALGELLSQKFGLSHQFIDHPSGL